MKRFFLALFAVFFVLAPAQGLHAQPKTFAAAKPLPDVPFWDEKTFAERTRLIRNKSPNDEFLAYEINVPKDWAEVKADTGQTVLGDRLLNTLVEFESPPRSDMKNSRIIVQAIELKSAITPERWLLEYMIGIGRHIEYMGIHSNSRAEALVAYVERGDSFVERIVVEVNGQKALIARYTMPVEAWNDESTMQAQTISGFKLLNEFQGVVDNLNKYDFLDAAQLRFPFEWTLRADEITSADRMKANILNVPNVSVDLRDMDEIDGRIEVEMVSIYGTETLTVELGRQQEEFKAQGFEFVKEQEVEIPTGFYIDRAFDFAKIQAFKSVPMPGKRVLEKELWFAVMGAGDYYYFIKMLTPSRSSEYYLWLRNTEVFKIVIEGLRPNLKTESL